MSKYSPKVGDTGTFYPAVLSPSTPPTAWRAHIEHVWSDTCVNVKTEFGTPTSVFVYEPIFRGQPMPKPTGYYFLPDALVNADPIEAEIQAKGLTAPRVTPQDIESNILSEHYFTAADGVAGMYTNAQIAQGRGVFPDEIGRLKTELKLLTFCTLILRNGFTVTGESACASPENFDADIGKKIARAAAVNKIWPLMGYELKSQLAKGGA